MAELEKSLFSAAVDLTQVEVDMLDFSFVESCEDWKKLFSILEVLRSGKEGHYPELIKVTEAKMLEVMPNKEKRKYLALNTAASADEIARESSELQNWLQSTVSIDAQLKTGSYSGSLANGHPTESKDNLFAFISRNQRDKISEAERKMRIDELSTFQKERRAELERRKGNESFKASEYETAVRCYTNSISLLPFNDSIWANRAIAYIKLKFFDLAEQDCDVCLHLNSTNVKAFARRGFARFSQGKYKAAALDYLEAMRLDSANEEYPKFLAKSKDLYASTEGKPLVFEEVQSATSDKKAIEQAPIRIVQSVIQSALFGEWEKLNCERVQSLSGMLVPASEISLSKKAMMRTFASSSNNDILPTENINVDDEDKDEAYVKIPVSFVDDDDDDDDDEFANENTDRQQFVRIAIAENENEDEETNSAQNDTLNLEANAGITKQMTSEEKALQLKNYGNSMMLRYDWNSSIAAYSRSLFHQFSIATLNNRAQAKLSSQDFAGAIADTNEVLNGEPNNVKALYRRAKAHFELQHWDACQRDLNIILQLEPHNAPALKMQHNITDILCQQQAELCKTQGNVLFQQGDIYQALQLYTTSLELVPNNPSVLSNRALAFLALEQFSESISDCDSVIADSKGNTTDATAAIVRKAYQRRSEARFRRVSSSSAETQLLEKQSELKCALEDAESALKLAMLHSPETVDKQKDLIKNIRKYIDSLTEDSSLPPLAVTASVTPSKVTCSQEESPAAIQRESSESATKSVKISFGSAQKGRLSESRVGVPATPAKTLYEFERAWRDLSGRKELQLEYLRLFKSSHLKKVFKAAISDDLLASIFTVLSSESIKISDTLCVRVLESLQQMNSFSLTIRMLPHETQQQLRRIFERLIASSDVAEETQKLENLKSSYSL